MHSIDKVERVYYTYSSMVWETLKRGDMVSASFAIPSKLWGLIARTGNKETCRIVYVSGNKVVVSGLKEFLEADQSDCFLVHQTQLEKSSDFRETLWRAQCWIGRSFTLGPGDDPRQFVMWLAQKHLRGVELEFIEDPPTFTENVLWYIKWPFSLVGATYSYFFPDMQTMREQFLRMEETHFLRIPDDFEKEEPMISAMSELD